MLAGVKDCVLLLKEAMAGKAASPRTHTVTWKQLSNAVESLAALLETVPSDAMDWAARFMELSECAQTLDDIAQTLHQEEGHEQVSETRVWAAAIRACIESHVRDAEILLPWLRLQPEIIAAMARRPSQLARRMGGDRALFSNNPQVGGGSGTIRCCSAGIALPARANAEQSPWDRDALARIDALTHAISHSSAEAAALIASLLDIAHTADKMFFAMDFTFLFDSTRKLFSIGYRATDGSLDPNCYDLLASEARLTSFIAIAKGDVPSSHWFRLGRALTPVGRGSALISWSGSMFEYLMPALVMRSPAGSMLSQTYQQVVHRQIEYGTGAQCSLGGFRVSIQRSRSATSPINIPALGFLVLGLNEGLARTWSSRRTPRRSRR